MSKKERLPLDIADFLPRTDMASRQAKNREEKRSEKSSTPKKASTSAQSNNPPDTLEPSHFESFFLHGSEDSRDLDVVYILKSDTKPFPTNSSLVEFCGASDAEDRNVVQLAPADDGVLYVQRSFRGPPDEVNNALLTTHRNHPSAPAFDFPLTQKVCRAVLLRYTIAAKAIIVKMRRIEPCRTACIAALTSWSFSDYMKTIRTNCAPCFGLLSQGAAKFVTFHMAQSYALSAGIETYSKRSLVGLFPELEPLIYYQGDESAVVDAKLVAIITKLHGVWSEQTNRVFCHFVSNKALHWQAFYLQDGDAIARLASNYLEVDCCGAIIDMHAERLVALPPPIPLLSSPERALSLDQPTIVIPPTWPHDITIVSSASPTDEAQWTTFARGEKNAIVAFVAPKTVHPFAASSSTRPFKSGKGAQKQDQAEDGQEASSRAVLKESGLSQTLNHQWITTRQQGDVIEQVMSRSHLTLRTHSER